ncbi:MAG: triose-phosphate isomerase [Candidatus Micrarchaeota archaeon]|nr:triose-phosphate isomerase [Candidatus Micrarchaeota archaeon]
MPVIALNFKVYPESTGANAVRLANAAESVAEQNPGVDIVICPPNAALALVCSSLKSKGISVFAQHCHPNKPGAFTGTTTPEELRAIGCGGTLLNHAEKKIQRQQIAETLERARATGIRVIACAKDVEEGVALAKMRPWAVAVEPPELIGSGISVSTAQPEVVKGAVEKIKEANPGTLVLVGAGVSNAADVAKCIELGAQGVLLASAFVKAKDPAQLLKEMAAAAQGAARA